MKEIRTHYDNLKVARNAPIEVIRAAYRALAQRHHPDLNKSDDAQRVMKILNEAWEVLGNQRTRAEHDEWIAEQERTETAPPPSNGTSFQSSTRQTYAYTGKPADWSWKANGSESGFHSQSRGYAHANERTPSGSQRQRSASTSGPTQAPKAEESQKWNVGKNFAGVAILLLVFYLIVKSTSTTPSTPSTPSSASSASTQSPYTTGSSATQDEFEARWAARQRGSPLPDGQPLRSTESEGTAPKSDPKQRPVSVPLKTPPTSHSPMMDPLWSPNGRPWPVLAGYLQGMAVRASGGLSKFTVDNTNGGSDVYVKLCRPSQEKCDGLRHIFIPNGSSFTMTGVAPGAYEIRYRDLSNGAISKSEPMTLRQIEEDQGTRFSVLKLTLYRVADGNTSFSPVSEDRF